MKVEKKEESGILVPPFLFTPNSRWVWAGAVPFSPGPQADALDPAAPAPTFSSWSTAGRSVPRFVGECCGHAEPGFVTFCQGGTAGGREPGIAAETGRGSQTPS